MPRTPLRTARPVKPHRFWILQLHDAGHAARQGGQALRGSESQTRSQLTCCIRPAFLCKTLTFLSVPFKDLTRS